MQLLFFTVVAVCIAVGQGQLVDLQPPAVIAFDPASTTTDAPSSTTLITSSQSNNDDDDSKENPHKHSKHIDHDHVATVSIDLHPFLELFKQELKAVEERVLAAIHDDHTHSPATTGKSYRTADR